MKISNKMKKLFVTILATTLSIVMFMTSASAADMISSTKQFSHPDVLSAYHTVVWDTRPNRRALTFSIDLECYENEDVEEVIVEVSYDAYYPSRTNPIISDLDNTQSGTFNESNTEDSDEIIINIPDYGFGHYNIEVIVTVNYDIHYYNGLIITYEYRNTIIIDYGELSHVQTLITYHYNDDNVVE